MSRKKQAVVRNWDYLNKKIDDSNKPNKEKKEKEITEEEHKEKIKMLKEIGILKD